MKRRLLSLALMLALPAFAQSSHVDANVPDEKDFQTFLKRDVLAYLRAKQPSVGDDIQIELLRDAPTQSGVSYPKYYAWVRFKLGVMKQQQGAVRLAAIEKLRFDVTDFMSAADIKADVQAVERAFPRALVPAILAKAAQS